MQDILVGLLALIIGATFCFRGFVALRVIIPIWGAFAGFLFGAGLIASTGDGFLRTAVAWIVGLGFALLFGLLAYFYYELSIVFAMASVGFALGTGIMVAVGVSWTWLIVLVGAALGLLLAMFAIASDIPGVVLIILGAMGGAVSIIAGLMLLVGTLNTLDFTSANITQRIDDSWWWYGLYVLLVVGGIIIQLRTIDRIRTSARAAWIDAGGKALMRA